MTDTELILKEIGDMKGTIASGFGQLAGEIAVQGEKLDALAGSRGRVTVIEERLDKSELWTKIHSLAIIFIPPGFHQLLKFLGILN